ncbi:MAG: SRPBCC domain-containing protein, partial [Amphiplicatus sp.]|nr:SRPBCC domain-containing protein [Amphiplicatus sp.]
FDSVMFGPNGEKFASEGSFLEVVPARRVVFTDLLAADWRPLEGEILGFTAAITFEDDGAGTRYSARVRHRNAADLKKHEEMGFHDGWSAMLGQLEEYAKSL